MEYNGTSWVTVGTAGFSAGGISVTSLAIDASGTPYVAFAGGSTKFSTLIVPRIVHYIKKSGT
ncbi:MAG TPA: hypothetical protein VMU83_01380 [Hanamia sp.]|nr:hypothetical protein [Hanamia sp.]